MDEWQSHAVLEGSPQAPTRGARLCVSEQLVRGLFGFKTEANRDNHNLGGSL